MTRIAIIGLGLIGGSLALGIKASDHPDVEIVGNDADASTLKEAQKRGAIDQAESRPSRAVEGAGLVIVAVPPVQMIEVFESIAPHLGEGAAVTDVASSKVLVMDWAQRTLPPYVSFIGGHPMAGKTDQGFENAEAGLFRDRPYAVVPATDARETALQSVLGLIRSLGAQERFMAADEHDDLVAAVSHMPLLASTALFTMLRRSEGWADFGKMAGPAYHDLTRLASGDPQMSTDIAVTNRARMQYWLDRYVLELRRVRDLLDDGPERIFDEFQQSQLDRARFQAGQDLDDTPRLDPLPQIPSPMGALLSPALYERLRGMIKRSEEDAGRPARR